MNFLQTKNVRVNWNPCEFGAPPAGGLWFFLSHSIRRDNNVLKERLVLDLSRHVNTFIPDKHIKLDDLSVSEHLLDVNDYMASFDLKNQFFHVKLHPSMYKFCGFSCADEAGKVCFYQF